MSREIKVGRYKVVIHNISVYLNKKQDKCEVSFTMKFKKSFRNHSEFHHFYNCIKLGEAIRKVILDLVEERLVDFNHVFTEKTNKDLKGTLKLNRGYNESFLIVDFNCRYTSDMELLIQHMNELKASCNYVQYES